MPPQFFALKLGASSLLYLVATPLGNLGDFSFRAVEVLQKCSYILCEDTRHSSVLLHHYNIKKELKSFHSFNEAGRERSVIEDLKNGLDIALISDAGTPAICDPGERLLERCYKEKIGITSIPGPCALAVALSLCSFRKEKIQFLGFCPKKEGERTTFFSQILTFSGSSFFYETPHHIEDTLEHIVRLDPKRKVGIYRELTKKFEEIIEKEASDLLSYIKEKGCKGEIVVGVEGEKGVFSLIEIKKLVFLAGHFVLGAH
mgnify:CR=1 FL=1